MTGRRNGISRCLFLLGKSRINQIRYGSMAGELYLLFSFQCNRRGRSAGIRLPLKGRVPWHQMMEAFVTSAQFQGVRLGRFCG